MTARYDYVTIGHVTRDVVEDRGAALSQAGGGAFYSALQAARLGLRTLIITQGQGCEIEALLEPFRAELDVDVIAAARTTTLSTRGIGVERTQRLAEWAGPMVDAPGGFDTSILHFAPVARETPTVWSGSAEFVGITPQGLVRRWGNRSEVPLVQLEAGSLPGEMPPASLHAAPLPGDISPVALDPATLPTRFDAAVIGEQERGSCTTLFGLARRAGAYVAVTAGSRPTTVYVPGEATGITPLPDTEESSLGASDTPGNLDNPWDKDGGSVIQAPVPSLGAVQDDLGAGDVFAAAFFVSLREGRSPLQAAHFANAAAALKVTGVGPAAIAGRARIEAMLRSSGKPAE